MSVYLFKENHPCIFFSLSNISKMGEYQNCGCVVTRNTCSKLAMQMSANFRTISFLVIGAHGLILSCKQVCWGCL